MVFSFRQNIDLVERDYYDKGANYTEQIEINKRSEIYQDSINTKAGDIISIEFCESIGKA